MRSKSFKKFYCKIIVQLKFLIKNFLCKIKKNFKYYKPDIKRFTVLPYAQRNCKDFAIRLKQLVNNNFPRVNFNVAYQTPKTIGSCYPFKDNIKRDMDKSLEIKNIKCTQCHHHHHHSVLLSSNKVTNKVTKKYRFQLKFKI